MHSCVASLEASLAKLFDTPTGWGLYEAATSQGKATERWLDGRHTLSWLLPIAGALEWRERSRVAELVFLNGTRTRVRVDESVSVGRIVHMIGNKLGLPPNAVGEYGVRFGGQLSAGLGEKDVLTSGWLDPRLTLQEQGVTSATKLELRWLKRFFVADHTVSSTDEVTMHYCFLECKNAFLSDVLDTTAQTANDVAKCVACLLHVDHGKYDKKKHTQQWYAGKKYVPESWCDVVSFGVAATAWKQLGDDLAPKKTFIDKCRKFPGFASTFFEGVVLDGRQDAQVAVSQEKVVLYHPWSVAARLKNQRRLSRSALALSPRGGSGEEGEPIRPTPLNRSGTLTGRRGSIMRHEEDADDDSLRSSSIGAPSPSSGGEGKSPRGLLSRTFARRDKKGSSPNLLTAFDKEEKGGGGGATKSGRFKSFAGLRDLTLLKRSGSKMDDQSSESPASSATPSPPPQPTGGATPEEEGTSAVPAVTERGESELAPEAVEDILASMSSREGRKEIRSIALEDIQKWGVRGALVVLEMAPTDTVELTFPGVDAAKDFSDLLRGYCLFRLEEESPAIVAGNVAEKRSYPLIGDLFALRPFSVQLVAELHARLDSMANLLKQPDAKKELESLGTIVRAIFSGSVATGNTLSSKALQLLQRISDMREQQLGLKRAVEALSLALGCAFVQDADNEYKPCLVLDSAKGHAFAALTMFAALSNGLRSECNDAAATAMDILVDGLLASLDEAVKRPLSVEAHYKMAQTAMTLAPQFVLGIKNGSSEAVRALATYCRDALSELLAAGAPIMDATFNGSDDAAIKSLWEAEASVRSLSGVPASAAVMAVASVCARLAKQNDWESAHPCVDAVVASLAVVCSSATRGGNAKSRATCSLVAEVVALVIEFVGNAFLRSQTSLAMKLSQVRLEEAVERLVRHVLAGSVWEASRASIAKLESEMASLASVENLSPPDQKEWEESWKLQTNDLSGQLKAFKANMRGVAQSSQVTGALVESWTTSLCDVVKQVRLLIAPFFSADSSAVYMSSSTAIVRAVQLMGADFVRLVNQAALHPEEKLGDLQSSLATDIDGCLSALNSNNPSLVGVRGDAGRGGWTRRGEISTQGAALKLKLHKKKTAATSDNKFLAGRKKQESSSSLESVPVASVAPATPATAPGPSSSPSVRTSGSASRLPMLTKPKRPPSGEWEEEA